MVKIFKHGISGNTLKLIALITMIIDHIGYYFEPYLNESIIPVLRGVGRISMPLYTFLIVQGFFYTSNFKKYITRMGILAVVTQIVITIVAFFDFKYVDSYYINVVKIINVLFTYMMTLGMLKLFHESIIVKKWDYTRNMSLKVILILLMEIALIMLPFDYGVEIPLLAVLFYIIEKFKIKYMIKTDGIRKMLGQFVKVKEGVIVHVIYVLVLAFAIFIVTMGVGNSWATLLAIIPLALYNSERGNKSKILKYVYYLTFPLQHVLLYGLSLILALT